MVTPFVGVWIETTTLDSSSDDDVVTPFVGVWIETLSVSQNWRALTSHTLRGCVDWNMEASEVDNLPLSHTLRGCVDWNNNQSKNSLTCPSVTPFVGVWIETRRPSCQNRRYPCHTLRGCVDWNFSLYNVMPQEVESHPSWVCGLKLLVLSSKYVLIWVTPFVGVWIETRRCGRYDQLQAGHTLRGCVDWNKYYLMFYILLAVTPFVGVWIETSSLSFR